MIKTVKSLYLNMVALHEKYVKEAEAKGESITVLHGDAKMVIPASEIKYRIAGRSAKPFIDKYDRSKYYLIYFEWHPESHQYNFLV